MNTRRLKTCVEPKKNATKYNDVVESLAGSYVHVKYRNPEILEQFEETINKMPPDEADAFYARAARFEAGDLIRIIARQGETREANRRVSKKLSS